MTASEGIALAGIVLSALLGYLGYRTRKEARVEAGNLEGDRWAREDMHRNRGEKVAAYAALLAAMASKIVSLVGDMNLAQVGHPPDTPSRYTDDPRSVARPSFWTGAGVVRLLGPVRT